MTKQYRNRITRVRTRSRSRRCFTLLQVLVAIGIIAILAAVLLPAFSRSRAAARRAQCDSRLKAIVLALDAFRQEQGKYPQTLEELQTAGYLNDPDALRCPDDPRPKGTGGGYGDYYLVRAPRDEAELPILVCPFHEEDGHGAQGFKGKYTSQMAAKPAIIVNARNATIERPGKNPIAAAAGMALRGGDRIVVGSGIFNGGLLGTGLLDSGQAVIQFADGSTATLQGGTDMTILQSFVMGSSNGSPLYTLVKQAAGKAAYSIHHGSRFDVGTPTATAGARGTEFTITIETDGSTSLYVENGKVLFTTLKQSMIAPLHQTVNGLLNGLINILFP